ncbi:hypothetical protein B0H13DRAFT_2470986 [Mycena leptocephala]|nr:hypothetical protein B0H13DRAFT_2470986 [Mycena leptocephala]
MHYTVDSQRFDDGWNAMMQLLLEMGVSLLLYGGSCIYISLFLLTIHLLFRRRKSPGIKLLIVISCIMAVVGTAQMAVAIAETVVTARLVQQVVHSQVLQEHMSLSKFSVLKTIKAFGIFINNFVTDSLFLYRCYMIWGFRRKVLIVPVLLMLSTFVMGIVWVTVFDGAVNATRIIFVLAAATNLVLTALTGKSVSSNVNIQLKARSAGRILWIRHAASHVGLDCTIRSRYNTTIGLILESGAIYCLAVIFLVVAVSLNDLEFYYIGLGIAEQLIVSIGHSRLS